MYIIYLFETIVSKPWPLSSVFFFNHKYNFPWGQYLVDIESFSFLLSSQASILNILNTSLCE